MLDIKFIRENPERVKKGVADKQLDPAIVDKVLELDQKRRNLLAEIERLRAERNRISKQGNEEKRKRGTEIKNKLKELDPLLRDVEKECEDTLCQIPNLPADDVPVGKDEKENKVLRSWGEPKKFDFEAKDHLELGEALDLVDTKQSAKVSGARFTYLKNDAVLLEFALINFAYETLIKEEFTPIIPPTMLRVPVFHSLGYSENLGNEEYYLVGGGDPEKSKKEEEAEYYLIGTAEHAIVPYHLDQVLKAKDLPKRYIGFSSCFRREAGSYGKDTKGIFRLHQFDKVEMVSFAKPEESEKEHEYLLGLEEKLFQALGIPYQVVKMCTGDLGAPASKKYDLETWIPSQKKYREVTSTSNCTDYQARRLNIKYQEGGENKFVHTLNGTAFAIGRTIIAIIENYQQKDGSIVVPEVLHKWVGKNEIVV